jgi:hypothetical protein
MSKESMHGEEQDELEGAASGRPMIAPWPGNEARVHRDDVERRDDFTESLLSAVASRFYII